LLPGAVAEIGEIRQEIEAPSEGAFAAQNVIELLPRGSAFLQGLGVVASSAYVVEAACKRLDSARVSLAFIGGAVKPAASLGGQTVALPPVEARLPDTVVEALEQLLDGRVYLETTYLDEDFRIARGPGRELYILSRDGDVRRTVPYIFTSALGDDSRFVTKV
jgi:hypothetical protein